MITCRKCGTTYLSSRFTEARIKGDPYECEECGEPLKRERLGAAEAAKILGVTPKVIRDLVDSKKLKGYRLPGLGAVRVLEKDLISYSP